KNKNITKQNNENQNTFVLELNPTNVLKHKTGIYDKSFIIFALPKILLEDQQSNIVSKCILSPENYEIFLNYILPNSCRDNAKIIDFNKLKNIKVTPIGYFGEI